MTASSTCIQIDASTTICNADLTELQNFIASTSPAIYNGFTAGEILIGFFLLVFIIGALTSFIVFKFLGIRIKGR